MISGWRVNDCRNDSRFMGSLCWKNDFNGWAFQTTPRSFQKWFQGGGSTPRVLGWSLNLLQKKSSPQKIGRLYLLSPFLVTLGRDLTLFTNPSLITFQHYTDCRMSRLCLFDSHAERCLNLKFKWTMETFQAAHLTRSRVFGVILDSIVRCEGPAKHFTVFFRKMDMDGYGMMAIFRFHAESFPNRIKEFHELTSHIFYPKASQTSWAFPSLLGCRRRNPGDVWRWPCWR